MLAAFALALPAVQTVALEVDLNEKAVPKSSQVEDANSWRNELVELGGWWYFSAHTFATGKELHRTDGKTVELVVDAYPGPEDGAIESLRAVNGRLWFQADDGVTGAELWTSDGTPAGTYRVADIWAGVQGSEPQNFVDIGDDVLFWANDGVHEFALWRSDGTPAGTQLVRDIDPSTVLAGTPFPSSRLYEDGTGSRVFLRANDGVHGLEPWVTDGTAAGTTLLTDVNPGAGDSLGFGNGGAFFTWNGATYFGAWTTAGNLEPWITDGTPAGTQQLVELNPGPTGSSPEFKWAAVMGGALYFPANSGQGVELHRTDGTAAGTQQVANLKLVGGSDPEELTVSGERLFFFAESNNDQGVELHVSDGTAARTNIVTDLYPGAGDAIPFSPFERFLFPSPGGVLFSARGANTGFELFTSDGTASGTNLVADIYPTVPPFSQTDSYPHSPAAGPNSSLLFIADGGASGVELYIYDSSGVRQLVEVEPAPITESAFENGALTTLGSDRILLSADDGVHGSELHVWAPGKGTTLLADINPGGSDTAPTEVTTGWLDGALQAVFVARFSSLGSTLWITDGTPEGTRFLADPTGTSPAADPWTAPAPKHLVYHPGHRRVYFAAEDREHGWELWATDGTTAGTVRITDFARSESLYPQQLTPVGERLYFVAEEDGVGRELFVTDGSPEGTRLVQDLEPGRRPSYPTKLMAYGDALFFFAREQATGREPYRLDANGMQLVKDISPGPSDSFSFLHEGSIEPQLHRGSIYFAANDSVHGLELWRTDLTTQGTQLVKDILPGPLGSLPTDYRPSGSQFFFRAIGVDAAGADVGRELHVLDSTTGIVSLVLDTAPGPSSSATGSLLAASDGIYFSSLVDGLGRELRFTDGTEAGTHLVSDVHLGSSSSNPSSMVVSAGQAYFLASHHQYGRELFRLEDPGALSWDLGLGGGGGQLSVSPPVMGGAALVEGRFMPPSTLGIVVMSQSVASPSPQFVAPGQLSWLDPSTARVVLGFTGSDFNTTIAIPSTPGLAGLRRNVQTLCFTGGLLPLTSNGVTITLGL